MSYYGRFMEIHARNFLRATNDLSPENGFALICLLHQLSIDEELLYNNCATIVKMTPEEFDSAWLEIGKFFVVEDGVVAYEDDYGLVRFIHE